MRPCSACDNGADFRWTISGMPICDGCGASILNADPADRERRLEEFYERADRKAQATRFVELVVCEFQSSLKTMMRDRTPVHAFSIGKAANGEDVKLLVYVGPADRVDAFLRSAMVEGERANIDPLPKVQ